MRAATVLRRARTESGLTLRSLAQRAGTSHSTISAYETGTKTPSVETLNRIVRAAGFELDVQLARRITVAPDGPTDRGRELEAVLELASHFPARHAPTLDAPIFARCSPPTPHPTGP